MRVNRKQRFVLYLGAAIIVLMLLVPPFHFQADGSVLNLGYSFLLDPPQLGGARGTVNEGLLFVQWMAVLLVTALLVVALKDRD